MQVTVKANANTNLETPDVFYFGTKPGDADGDGDVDGADYVAWQTNFPTSGGATWDMGDFDGDGYVTGADYIVWQTNYPFTPIALDASATVLRTIGYQYDALGRLLEVTDRDGSNNPASADYTYDYDNLNRVTSITQNLVGLAPEIVFALSYTQRSQRESLTATLGGTADFKNEYLYDNLGRIEKLTQQGQGGGNTVAEKRVDFAYNLAGQFDTITRYADLAGTENVGWGTYGYDGVGRLTTLVYSTPSSGGFGYTWQWDAANRITSVANPLYSSENATYSYDDAGQLTGADRSGTTNDEDYDYDDNGNRDIGYTTGLNNQMTSDGTYTYQYDGEGNLIQRTRISDDYYTVYEWDHRNRLVEVSDYNSSEVLQKRSEYTYDAFDRRIAKHLDTDGDGDIDRDEFYVYDGSDIVLDFVDADGEGVSESPELARRYLWGPAVDQLLAQEDYDAGLDETADLLWALTDHQGSVRDLVRYNTVTNTISFATHYKLDAFGNIQSGNTSLTRYIYTGQEYDAETGLYYYDARYYAPNTGRFLGEDPIGVTTGDANLYRYVGNSPTIYVDPSGQILEINFQTVGAMWDAFVSGTPGPSMPSGRRGPPRDFLDRASDFFAGWADTLSFGLTNGIRNIGSFNDRVDHNSTAYSAGEIAGIANTTAFGVADGLRAAETRGAGREFSHWIPKRMGGPRNMLNGNYISPWRHFKHDPFRFPVGAARMGDKWHPIIQQLDRIPRVYVGTGIGAGVGVGGQAVNDLW